MTHAQREKNYDMTEESKQIERSMVLSSMRVKVKIWYYLALS